MDFAPEVGGAIATGGTMHDILSSAAIGGIVGAVAGGMAVLLFAILQPASHCPDCDTLLPKFGRKHARPGNRGGRTCPECGCEVDRKGNKVKTRKVK
jgi:hypothetical protein